MARRVPISNLRDRGSFRRARGQKPPRSITLIICEGETEQEYFEAARIHYGLTRTEIILSDNTKGPAPISVVECAEAKCAEPGSYDQVYCIFDRDGHESFDRARQKIKSLASRKRKALPIKEAISIPCFELWVLLHFERTDAPFNHCANVITQVRTHMARYEKADSIVAKQLMERIDVALGNADWLENRAENNDYNPYTSIHKVLRHFETTAKERETP